MLASPRYILALTLTEFSILNVAEMDGLLKYGGSGEFQLKMAKEGSDIVWNLKIDNPRLMELLGIFVGEKTMKLVQSLDPEQIDPNQKLALAAIKTLSQKLEYAQKNPVWDSMKLSGTITQKEADWFLQTKDDEQYKIVGDKLADLQSQKGNPIVADGFVKKPSEFEVTNFIERHDNTLEVFVMSLCPFGQQAETNLLAFLAKSPADSKPRLDVHYIFYKQEKDGKEVFATMHGEEELMENLVQMVIRDSYPDFFQAYLQMRAKNNRMSWMELAGKLGFSLPEIDAIGQLITTKRDEMIRKEYEYAVNQYDIKDGSPTYVWESERVADLRKIPAFKGLEAFPADGCAQ